MKLFSKDGSELEIRPDELVNGGKKDMNNKFVKQIDEKDKHTGLRIHFTRFKSFGNCHWEVRFKKVAGPFDIITRPQEKDYYPRGIKKISFIETPTRNERVDIENSPCPGNECQNSRYHPTDNAATGTMIEPESAPEVESSKGASRRIKSSYSTVVTALFILWIYIMRNNH